MDNENNSLHLVNCFLVCSPSDFFFFLSRLLGQELSQLLGFFITLVPFVISCYLFVSSEEQRDVPLETKCCLLGHEIPILTGLF